MLRLATLLCLVAAPAMGADLRGHWNVTIPKQPGYLGSVLIDAQQRVAFDAPLDQGRPAAFIGYIRTQSPTAVEMLMTNKEIVNRMLCAKESSEMMRCLVLFADNKQSDPFVLTRVGDGPDSLISPHSRPR